MNKFPYLDLAKELAEFYSSFGSLNVIWQSEESNDMSNLTKKVIKMLTETCPSSSS